MTKIIAYRSVEEIKSQNTSLKKKISPAQALKNTLDLMSFKRSIASTNGNPKHSENIKWFILKP
ncbi:MAG: hypothetical protein ABFS32_05740 [Bacteroidota bacterium]